LLLNRANNFLDPSLDLAFAVSSSLQKPAEERLERRIGGFDNSNLHLTCSILDSNFSNVAQKHSKKTYRAKTWFDKLMVRPSLTILSFCRRTTLSNIEGPSSQKILKSPSFPLLTKGERGGFEESWRALRL
jgi:hypothetical protein